MQWVETTQLTPVQIRQVHQLWNEEYPSTIIHNEEGGLLDYLDGLTEPRHVLLLDLDESVCAWWLDFIRDEDRWFAMIVTRNQQGKGYGRQLLDRAKEKHSVLNGWTVQTGQYQRKDGSPYVSPIVFYKKNDFQILESVQMKTPVLETVKIRWEKKI